MANINVRIDDGLKREAESLFDELGLNMTTATTLFLKQCVRCRGIPFELSADPFYSAVNRSHLAKAAKQMDDLGGTPHSLIEVDDG